MKNKKKCEESICKYEVAFFTMNSPPLTRGVTCSKLQRYGENIGDKKLPVEHSSSVAFHVDTSRETMKHDTGLKWC